MSRTSAGTSSFVSISDIVVHYSPYAPVVKRISHQSSELTFQVRILAGAKSTVSISVRVPGIEPGSFDWQPNVLPLNHTRFTCTVSHFNYSLPEGNGDSIIHRKHSGDARDYTGPPEMRQLFSYFWGGLAGVSSMMLAIDLWLR